MSDDIAEELDSSNQPTEEVDKTEEVEEAPAEEATEDTQPEYTEREIELYGRLKKAQGFVQDSDGKWVKPVVPVKPKPEPKVIPSTDGSLSTKDLYALMDAKVPQDDVDDVVEYAKLKKIPVAQALKTNVVKAILSEKAEERKTAETTSVGTARRGTSKVSDETLLERFSTKGELPENDADMIRLARQKIGLK